MANTYKLLDKKSRNIIVINKTKEIKVINISIYDENSENYKALVDFIHFTQE